MQCFLSYSQLTAILLDTVVAMKSQKATILQVSLDNYINFHSFFLLILLLCMGNQAVIQRPRDNTKFIAMLNIWENGSVEYGNSFCNRLFLEHNRSFRVSLLINVMM